MPVSSVTEHWIKQDAITINLNHFGDPDYLQVSVLAGAVVMAFKQDVIGYNAAHNYRTWPLQAANTYLENTSAVNVYARLTRSEVNASALIIYDSVLRDIEGRAITYAENGSEILGNADTNYFYVFLGQISGSIDNNGEQIERNWEVSFRFGNLDTSQYRNEESGGEWMKMFRLNKVTDMIDVLKTFSSAIFKRLFIGEKEIGNIQRSTDHLDIDDNVIPTTKYTEESYLSKKQNDHTPHSLSVGKNLSVGKKITAHDGLSTDDFLEGASGASVYQNKDGQWCIETDNVKARRKFSANEVEIQSTDHIGGQAILTAARMRIDYVLEESEYYRCYFRKADGEGNVIRNEWKPSDLAYCNTFNLERQSDGSIGNHYYWRKVVAVSSEANQDTESERTFGDEIIRTADYHFVDLSKLELGYAEGSNVPKAGDKVVQLGYSGNDDSGRQSAIVIAGAGTGSPYIQIFEGIHGFSLPSNPDQLKPGDNRLSGRLTIKAGSTGWQNLEGLDETIQDAVNFIETQEYGKNNLIRNSGFTGDYVTASLEGNEVLMDGSELFSPPLKYWVADGATVMDSDDSESGKEVMLISGGSLKQRLHYKMIVGESYVFSFKGRGIGSVTFSVGGYTKNFAFNSEDFEVYVEKFVASSKGDLLILEAYQDCFLCELQLERGTLKSAWGISPLDNHSELAKYESLRYMSDAIEKGSTDVMNGLILTNMMLMRNLENKVTSGSSGVYSDDNSVAYFAGGDMEAAVRTAMAYMDDPTYQPTTDELNNMAKFVVTHGGRAILNDVILRGYIYALGGKFRGEVEALKGTFNDVAFESGKLGNFKVENGVFGMLALDDKGNEVGKVDANSPMAMLSSQILFRDNARLSSIGVTSGSSAPLLGKFYDETVGNLANRALDFRVKGSTTMNFAFSGEGSGVLNGIMCGYGINKVSSSQSGTSIIDPRKGNQVLVSGGTSGTAANFFVGFPRLSKVREALDIDYNTEFVFPLTIINLTPSDLTVRGRNTTDLNSTDYPEGNGEVWDYEARTFMLVYQGGEYRAVTVS